MEMSDAALLNEVPPQNPPQRGRPNTGVTPRRCFRMSDRESSEVLAAAEFEQMTPPLGFAKPSTALRSIRDEKQ